MFRLFFKKEPKMLVIDPPLFKEDNGRNRYIFQEECCWDLRGGWTIPARSLQLASALGADYEPPCDSWDQVARKASKYDQCYMVMTYALWCAFKGFSELKDEVQQRFTILANSAGTVSWFSEHTKAGEVVGIDTPMGGDKDNRQLPLIDRRFWDYFDGQRNVTIQAASGCPFGCKYCVWRRRKTRWADPNQVADLSASVNNAYILAPQLTGNNDWLTRFVARRLEKSTSVPFRSTLNCTHVSKHEEQIRQLKRVGLVHAEIGTEAFSDSAIRKLGCSHTMELTEKMVALVAELGISAQFELRYGYGETAEEIDEMRENLMRIGKNMQIANVVHRLHTGPIFYWPGTELPMPSNILRQQRNGIETIRESLSEEQKRSWKRCHESARKVGWNVT